MSAQQRKPKAEPLADASGDAHRDAMDPMEEAAIAGWLLLYQMWMDEEEARSRFRVRMLCMVAVAVAGNEAQKSALRRWLARPKPRRLFGDSPSRSRECEQSQMEIE